MNYAFIDFETFWSASHGLSKMDALTYVMHPDTELISCAMAINDGPVEVSFGEEGIRRMLDRVDWSSTVAVGHNMSAFDSMILAWRLGITPKMYGCTLAMARPTHAKTTGLSLGKLVEHYGIGIKDNKALLDTKGKHLKDFTPSEIMEMRKYNQADTDQCRQLYWKLRPRFNAKELWHIDATIRMLVEPKFILDIPLLKKALAEEREAKTDALKGVARILFSPQEIAITALDGGDLLEKTRETLMSSAKFSDLLIKRGVPVPMKKSAADPSRLIPALARTDEAFIRLREHPDPLVSVAASARLMHKSTLLESRLEAFLGAASACGGYLPVPLHTYGADTTGRWSGWLYNPQNCPRIPRDKDGEIIEKRTNALRLSMRAPPGHKVVVADLSGIELRVNHFLWKVVSSMRAFQKDPEKADLYREFAADLYRVAVNEVLKDQRQIGKIAHLGLGFGASAKTFKIIAQTLGGVDMPLTPEDMPLEGGVCAQQVVDAWRAKYSRIVDGWRRCHDALPHILTGEQFRIDPWGLCHTERGAIVLPSGRRIYYPALGTEMQDNGRPQWYYGMGRHRTRIYAGKIDENIVQAIARDVIADCAVDFFKLTRLRPAHTVHDELIYVVPHSIAQDTLTELQKIMRRPPTWWPELVTWSEGDIAQSYGEAK